MTHARPFRPGLTLIELLAALAIVASVVSAGSAWTLTLTRTAQGNAQSAQACAARARVVAVLQQDLDGAQPKSVTVKEGTLECLTIHRPGDAVPAWREVSWSFDPTRHQLTREEASPHLSQSGRQVIDGLVAAWAATWEEAAPSEAKPARDTLNIVLEFKNRAGVRERAILRWRREP